MTDGTKMSECKLRHGKTRRPASGTSPLPIQARLATSAAGADNPAWRIERPGARPWPFRAEDTPPLAWWRTLSSDAFRDAERMLLHVTLGRISVLHGGEDFDAALGGDPAAAIGVAFSLMPITEMTQTIDIAMTALLCRALERNAAAALVLAQVIGLTDLGHSFATELAASWYTRGLRHSSNPRKFSQAEAVLLSAFRERHHDGGRA